MKNPEEDERLVLLREAINALFIPKEDKFFVRHHADNISSLKTDTSEVFFATNGGFLKELDKTFKAEFAKGNPFEIKEEL